MKFDIRYATILFILIFPLASMSVENNGFHIKLSHVDSNSNFTKIELLTRAATRTMHRLSQLTGRQLFSSSNISTTLQGHSDENPIAEYYMDLAIGNPPLYYSPIMDTGSDLIWTQCTPCQKCVSQSTPIYDSSNSSTVSSVPCNSTQYMYLCDTTDYPPPSCFCSYNYTYGTGWTSGTLKQETFTFGTTELVTVPSIIFGCSTSTSDDWNGTSGFVGFGRGPLSLPSQLNTSMFSYCLTSFLDTNSTSTLVIGPTAKFSGDDVKSTPFVKNPPTAGSYYYISLQGISFGTTKLSVPASTFTLQSNGTGGTIIDSGTTYTYLANEAYQAVENAIESIVELQRVNTSDIVFDLCYNLPSDSSLSSMPNMTLHLEDADMVLPVENYMVQFPYGNDNMWCLAMFSSDSLSLGLSILGNYQQQNFHILYDVDKEVLSFSRVQCDSL